MPVIDPSERRGVPWKVVSRRDNKLDVKVRKTKYFSKWKFIAILISKVGISEGPSPLPLYIIVTYNECVKLEARILERRTDQNDGFC